MGFDLGTCKDWKSAQPLAYPHVGANISLLILLFFPISCVRFFNFFFPFLFSFTHLFFCFIIYFSILFFFPWKYLLPYFSKTQPFLFLLLITFLLQYYFRFTCIFFIITFLSPIFLVQFFLHSFLICLFFSFIFSVSFLFPFIFLF